MALSRSFVRSLARKYSVDEMTTMLDDATDKLLKMMDGGVRVTGTNMKESGSSGEFDKGELERKIAALEAAIAFKKSSGRGRSNRRMSHIDFSRRTWGF